MIKKNQIKEIQKALEKAQNPLFIFDNDPDGLSSFLLLYRKYQKGKWVAFSHSLRNYHQLIDVVEFHDPDLIVLLDMPTVSQSFIDTVNLPIIHIDHHPLIKAKGDNYKYYNPRANDPNDARPTTYWAYQIVKQDIWIAMTGCIADWYIPDFTEQFNEKYPELFDTTITEPGKAYFDSRIGKLIKTFIFSLKGKKDDVRKNVSTLSKIENPSEILNLETPAGRLIGKYAEKFNKKYIKILDDALTTIPRGKIFLYTYPSSKDSFSSLLSNELIYRKSEYIVIVARVKEEETVLSLRSSKIKIEPLLRESLQGLHGYGGGHSLACGCKISNTDFDLFLERFTELIENS